MAKPLHFRTQQEILDRIYEAVRRGDQGDEFNEYMRCARFVPLILRSVYEDTVEADWDDYSGLSEPLSGACEMTVDREDVRDVDHTAKVLLPHFERAVRRPGGPNRVATMMRQYRAYKWLLGHADADMFLGHKPNPMQVYAYLMKQITSGEWDRMTKAAQRQRTLNNMKEYSAKRKVRNANSETPVNAQAVA